MKDDVISPTGLVVAIMVSGIIGWLGGHWYTEERIAELCTVQQVYQIDQKTRITCEKVKL